MTRPPSDLTQLILDQPADRTTKQVSVALRNAGHATTDRNIRRIRNRYRKRAEIAAKKDAAPQQGKHKTAVQLLDVKGPLPGKTALEKDLVRLVMHVGLDRVRALLAECEAVFGVNAK